MVLDNKVEGIRQDENDMLYYTVSTNEKQKRQLYL